MSTFTKKEAAFHAMEIVKAAVASGMLTPVQTVVPNPDDSGSKAGLFVGAMVVSLTKTLETL